MGQFGRILIYVALTLEAVLAAVIILAMVRMLPFTRYAGWLRSSHRDGAPPRLLVARVKRTMALVARGLPTRNRCLVSAMVARFMLSRRGFASQLTLGIHDAAGVMQAHAWLNAGSVIVTGHRTPVPFQGVATF